MNDRELGQPRRRHRANADEGGFVLPWFALMLIVLVAMAGFGVDVWNWWYTGQQEQRAADAAALAGVPFMPSNFGSSSCTGSCAVKEAVDAAKRNGYTIVDANVSPGPKANQLIVTIGSSVTNSFTSLLGAKTTDITRSATAEFNEPVQMGSPNPYIGCDPEKSCTAKHWLNIGAPHVDKITGDRYADYSNSGSCSAYRCSGGVNTEYNQNSYAYTIEVAAAGVGSNIDVQVYDAEYANGGTSCDQNWGAGTDGLTPQALTAVYPDAATRYKTGTGTTNDYCTGDDSTQLGTPQATVWMVRGIDGTPDDYVNNPIIQSGGPGVGAHCTKQFKGYNGTPFSDLLDNTAANTSGNYDADFAASFHRWYTMCNITSAGVGKYFIQVRSNVPLQTTQSDANLSKDEATPEDNNLGGQNRYAIRAVTHNTSTTAPNVQVYAATHLPVYANTGTNGTSPNFYLARLLPGGGATGRVLQLRFFDIGDVGCASGGAAGCGVSTVAITPPGDMTLAAGDALSCTWTSNGGVALPGGTVSGCTLSNITNSAYNGKLVEVDIAVPGSYNCTYTDITKCWFRLQMSYTNGTQANDTTTWDATIGGDPVRLIK